MRTTLDIDRDLLDRAKAAMGATTYTEAIERALQGALRSAELERALSAVCGRDDVWSLDELRSYRRRGRGHAD